MRSDRAAGERESDGASGRGTRLVTRRRFVAGVAAAGAGFGVAGLGIGGTGAGERGAGGSGDDGASRSSPTARRESATTADDDEADRGGDAGTEEPTETPVVGANLNGRPRRLLGDFELLDASGTTWVRAFLDVRKKLADGTDPANDPDVLALRRAAREHDCKLVVSLKWDFKANWGDKKPTRVPSPNSEYERRLCRCAAEYLGHIGEVDVVVLGNEPMWETLEPDIAVEDPPLLRFTRTVKDYLVREGDHGSPRYLVGAFNRIYDDGVRRRFAHFYREAFALAHEDEDVDGVDLHIHYDGLDEAEEMLALARAELPKGTLTVTEFCPVFRYARHVDDPLSASEGGERFARDHGLPAETTAVEYFEYAKRNPRPPEEITEFYDAVPWYNVNHVEDMYGLFADFGVDVGTFGLLQGRGMRNEDWTDGWSPFHINFLFQPALMRADRGVEHTANLHYIDNYRRRTVRE